MKKLIITTLLLLAGCNKEYPTEVKVIPCKGCGDPIEQCTIGCPTENNEAPEQHISGR